MKRRQRGVALLSVLLIMSLALLLTAGMLRSHYLMLQSSARQVHQLQLRQLALSAEAWAMLALKEAGNDEQQVVHLAQEWARLAWPFETDGGHIGIQVEDLSGRFNLNVLLGDGQVDQVTQQRWSRLLASLALKPLPLEGSGPVREPSQLRLLPGIDGETLRLLEPWVAVLPREASLNINTAPAPVLAMLEGVSLPVAQALVSQRPAGGYASAQAFMRDPLIAGLELSGQGLGVSSRWFRINVDVSLGTSRLRLVSEVERDRKTRRTQVVQRRFLPPLLSAFP